MAVTTSKQPFFALGGIPFVLVGLYFIFGRFIYKKRRKLRTLYGLTDRRAIVCTGDRSVSDTPVNGMPTKVDRSKDGRHVSVTFGSQGMAGLFGMGMYLDPGMDFFSLGLGQTVAFYDVEETGDYSVPWTKPESTEIKRRAGTIAWILLVLTSMVLIVYGIARAGWHIWLPNPADQEESWVGSLHIFAGCALSIAAAFWSGARENRLWVTICVGLPGALVGWAALDNPYDLKRFVAAVVAFPLALAGVAEVIRGRGRRQRD